MREKIAQRAYRERAGGARSDAGCDDPGLPSTRENPRRRREIPPAAPVTGLREGAKAPSKVVPQSAALSLHGAELFILECGCALVLERDM